MYKTPRQLPSLSTILADLDSPHPRDVARYLGVSERTVYGWSAAEQCPRPAHLALFWVSRWGASILATEAVNETRFHAAHAAALKRENATLRQQVAYLDGLQTGAANAPLFSVPAWLSQSGQGDFWPGSVSPLHTSCTALRRQL